MTTDSPPPDPAPTTEAEFNAAFCAEQGGDQEVRHEYSYGEGNTGYVVVDCETDARAWEGGLDKRSSLDSVQQALFFGAITGKQASVVIYDTDGLEGQYEHQIETAANLAGIHFEIYQWNDQEDEPEEGVLILELPDYLDGFDFWP